MENRKMIFCIVVLILSIDIQGQELYKPPGVRKAYELKRRSETGKPGEAYFQNHAQYTIVAEVNPEKKILSAREEIMYYNNSPDILSSITFNLYQNYLKKGNVRDRAIPANELTDGVQIEKLLISGRNYSDQLVFIDELEGTSKEIFLHENIYPGDSIHMEIKWHVSLPSSHIHRFGCYNTSSYFIGYWYPHIAVYDDIDGWDNISHTGLYEFYGDYNTYNVEITVPGKYAVWATGKWINPQEILKKNYLDKYYRALQSDEVVEILSQTDREYNNQPFLSKKRNTWIFSAENVSDFSFAISDNYLWDATSVCVDSLSNNRVLINAVYADGTHNFEKIAGISKVIVEKLSKDIIGIPYPFPQMTVFNGSGGMEYPMMVNERDMFDPGSAVYLTAHEICHSYLPFYVGTNEKKYGWIDEGLVTYLPKPIERMYNAGDLTVEILVDIVSNKIEEAASTPVISASYQLDVDAYYFNSYYRSAVSFYLLHEYLGDSLFYGGLKYFFNTWKYKHPIPYDLFNCFNYYTGRNLDWFWEKYFFSSLLPDLSLSANEISADSLEVTVQNKGGLPVPVKIYVYYTDKSKDEFYYSMDIWNEDDRLKIIVPKKERKIENIELGDNRVPDIDKTNNYIDW